MNKILRYLNNIIIQQFFQQTKHIISLPNGFLSPVNGGTEGGKKTVEIGMGLLLLLLSACSPSPTDVQKTDNPTPMYPDYTDITVPVNIAPLNFLLRNDAEAICVYANDKEIYSGNGNEVTFEEGDWKEILAENVGKDINVRVDAKMTDGQWREYKSFKWTVTSDKVDPYLTYRLIEPDYEVFNNLVLQERCVENFDERNFCDYNVVGNKCMNCHTYAQQDPKTSMFYVRGEGGGAILNKNGKLSKLAIKRPDMVSGSVYFGFSPSRRYIVFSTNVIIPAFHAAGSKRLEVFDTKSDVYVADLESEKFIESPLLSDSLQLETFPTFSPDGKYIYYCTAQRLDSLEALKTQRYSLCRITFDEHNGIIGSEVDTIYNARIEGKSVCHPRISPDGRFLIFTVADYGTFPIWHREADLAMLDLQTMKMVDCKLMNSAYSDTYHSWSSNSRWLVFASKRDDGLYGKPYYTHIDKNGRCTKPFVLPQAEPSHYDNTLKSYNAPEQGRSALPFDVRDVSKALKGSAVEFK